MVSAGQAQMIVPVIRQSGSSSITFGLPKLLVDDQTRRALQFGGSGFQTADSTLRNSLADAARELCLRAVEADSGPSPIIDDDCVEAITPASVVYQRADEPTTGDIFSDPVDAACDARCLLGDNCEESEAGGGSDRPPVNVCPMRWPRPVRRSGRQ